MEPVSSTDLLIFKQLANPEKTNAPDNVESLLQLRPPPRNGSLSPVRSPQQHSPLASPWGDFRFGAQHDGAPLQPSGQNQQWSPALSSPGGAPSPGFGGQGKPDAFDSFVQEEMSRMSRPKPDTPKPRSLGDLPSHGGQRQQQQQQQQSTLPLPQQSPDYTLPNSPVQRASFPQSSPAFNPSNLGEQESMNHETALGHRQVVFNKLREHIRKGEQLSVPLDESTPLHVLETELAFLDEGVNGYATVSQLKDGMGFAMWGIEMANTKLNSPIPLTGWHERVNRDTPNLYDHSLQRIYNTYFRNSFSNPFVELGQAMFLSACGHVAKECSGDSIKRPSIARPATSATFAGATATNPAGRAKAPSGPPPARPRFTLPGGLP